LPLLSRKTSFDAVDVRGVLTDDAPVLEHLAGRQRGRAMAGGAGIRPRPTRLLAPSGLNRFYSSSRKCVWERIQPIVEELERADATDRAPIYFANPTHEAYSAALAEEYDQRQRGVCPDGA
jgi:hypothetical protein